MNVIEADNPLPGFYWMRRERGGRRMPVAIWRHKETGQLVCAAGFDKAATDPTAIWTYCAENRIDSAAARFAWENGYFQDEPAPARLSNLPDDPFEALLIEIEAQLTRAEEWLKARPTIMTQADCDLATNMQRELLKLNKRADDLFKAEKAPLLEATRACDDKYRFRDAVASVAARLREVFGRFLAAEEKRQKAEAEAKFKAEQAAIAAERKRIEDERAKLREDDPIAALTSPEPELPLAPVAPEPVKVSSGGGIGKRAALQDVWVGTITDYREAALYFIEHPKLRDVVDKLVMHQVKDLKSSAVIPGVTVSKERRAA